MKGHSLIVKINGELIYDTIDSVIEDLKLVDDKIEVEQIDLSDDDDEENEIIYKVKFSSVQKIRRLKNIEAKTRLAKICMAIEFNMPVSIYIDRALKFTSIWDVIDILTHIHVQNGKCDICYFEAWLKKELESDNYDSKRLRQNCSTLINASIIAEMIEDYYSSKEEEDEWM